MSFFSNLFGSPNIEKLKRNRDIEGLIKALNYPEKPDIQANAAAALGEIRDTRAVEPLITALQNQNATVRGTVALALGQIGDIRAVDPLIAAFNIRGKDERSPLSQALGEIGDVRSVDILIVTLRDGDSNGRNCAAQGLKKIGLPAIEPLINSLSDRNKLSHLCAIQILGEIGDSRVINPLIAALQEDDLDIRKAAAKALGEIADARAVEPLIAVLKDEKVRKAAAEALGRIEPDSSDRLIAMIRNGDEDERKTAIYALNKMDWRPDHGEAGAWYWIAKKRWDKCAEIGSPAVDPLVATLKNKDEDVRTAAADALEKLGWKPGTANCEVQYWIARKDWDKCIEIGSPAVDGLIDILKDGNNADVLSAACTLGSIGDARAVDPLISLLGNSVDYVRLAAIGALVKIGSPAIDSLIPILNEGNKNTRKAAADTLGLLGWKPRPGDREVHYWISKQDWDKCVEIGLPAVDMLIDLLQHGDEADRMSATYALGSIRDARAVDPLIAALGNYGDYVQVAAIDSLVKIGQPAINPLIAALNDEDKDVRKAAVDALRKMTWQPQPGETSKETLSTEFVLKGNAFVISGDYEDAIQAYTNAIKLNPMNEDSLVNQGVTYQKLRQHINAILSFGEALKINPKSQNALFNTGVSNGELGHYEEAIRCYDRVLSLYPDDDDAVFNKNACLEKIKKLNKELTKDPEFSPRIYTTLICEGLSLSRSDYLASNRKYSEALNLNPNESFLWYQIGLNYFSHREPIKAIEAFDRAISIKPFKEVYHLKGECLNQIGDKKGAEESNVLSQTAPFYNDIGAKEILDLCK